MANETHLFLPYNLSDLSPYLRTDMVSFEIEYSCFAFFRARKGKHFKMGSPKKLTIAVVLVYQDFLYRFQSKNVGTEHKHIYEIRCICQGRSLVTVS